MDNARKKRKYRAIVACLLLLTMMPFFFVKAFHVHKEDLCISHDEQQSSHHDSADKCAICLFTLSSFTEAESFEYNCVQTENPVEYLIQKGEGHYCYFSPIVSPRSSCPTITIPLMGCMHYKMTCERGMLCPLVILNNL